MRVTPLRLAAAAALGVALVTLYVVDPSGLGVTLCPYRAVTGTACPGCGLTRALHHLLHAEFRTAFAYNPFVFVASPLVLAAAAAPRLSAERQGVRCQTLLGWTLVALTLAFWIWRNTPSYPFLRL